ncbi:MAG: hypothetical protein JST16_14555 [Bdellovibrionales bacterium]|nr:hypothetical protein [Bdellovibrionales bacterium]
MKSTLNTKIIFTLIAGFAAGTALAQEDKPITDEPTFRQIFRQSVEEAASLESVRRRDAFTIEVGAVLTSPNELTLSNKYFEVPHARSGTNLPGVQFGFSFGIVSNSRFRLGGIVTTGYSYAQYVGRAKSLKTGYESMDSLRLQRVPLLLGTRATYDAGPVALFVEPALGVQWLSQAGYLDGVSQNFWVPTAAITGGIVLFDQTSRSSSWFGGVRLAAGIERSLGSDQKIDMKQFEVGIRARL